MDDWEREQRYSATSMPYHRAFKDRSNPIDYLDDEEFRKRFRLTRSAFYSVVDKMRDSFEPTSGRGQPLTAAYCLAITLAVLSNNDFQLRTSDLFGITQPEVSKVIRRVTDWFAFNADLFVAWHSQREAAEMAQRVFHHSGIPNVVGMIDGTHIRINAPPTNEHLFVNRF